MPWHSAVVGVQTTRVFAAGFTSTAWLLPSVELRTYQNRPSGSHVGRTLELRTRPLTPPPMNRSARE